jgi:hypothetical protein
VGDKSVFILGFCVRMNEGISRRVLELVVAVVDEETAAARAITLEFPAADGSSPFHVPSRFQPIFNIRTLKGCYTASQLRQKLMLAHRLR